MTERALPRPGSVGAWVLAARPATLPVAVAPVVVGAVVASSVGAVRWGAVAAAMAGALLIQIGTNFANDVFDHDKGADDERRLGPPRAVQKGLLTARAVRWGMAVAFLCAALFGVWLAVVGGPVIIAIGVLSVLSGIAYTGGPYPLGYNGLGDLFVLVFFGPVAVVGTTWVAVGAAPPAAWLASVPIGALAAAVLAVNNVRDRAGDTRAGKRTLVVRYGRAFGVAEHYLMNAVAAAVPVVGWVLGLFPAATLAAIATTSFGFACSHRLATWEEGPRMNALLAGSAKVLLAYALVFAIGFAIGAP